MADEKVLMINGKSEQGNTGTGTCFTNNVCHQ